MEGIGFDGGCFGKKIIGWRGTAFQYSIVTLMNRNVTAYETGV